MKKSNGFHTVRGYQLLNQEERRLTSAMEDYLEMVYRSSGAEGYVRINTLSELLNVKPPSATKMVQKLTKMGFLDYKRYGIISLTEKGREIGEFLLKRHNAVECFLKLIGMGENTLVETELIEHNIGSKTLENITVLNRFFEKNPEIAQKLRQFRGEALEGH